MRLLLIMFLVTFTYMSSPSAAILSMSGNFKTDDDVQLFNVTVNTPGIITFRTTSNAVGGFDPMLALFDGTGNWIDFSDDDPLLAGGGDSRIETNLVAGSYTVAISQFGNFNLGVLGDGFVKTGQTNYTSIQGCSNGIFCNASGDNRLAAWAIEVVGASGLERISGDISAVPLPAALPLFGVGLLAFGIISRRRK
ncbi:MAG: DVUA0089 family protein [Sneathiella sp.]